MKIIAFGQASRVGKDTAARMLAEHLRRFGGLTVEVDAFARQLKVIAHQLFQQYGLRPGSYYNTPDGAVMRDRKLDGVGMTPVELWIQVGNRMRDVYPWVWADFVVDKDRDCDVLIISDLRFDTEATAVRMRDGVLVKIVRPDAPPPKGSDDLLPPDFQWDGIVHNDGDLEQLRDRVISMAEGLGVR